MRIAHFYHIYAYNHWREVVQQHLDAWQASGLSASVPIHVGIVGLEHERAWVKSFLEDSGVSHVIAAEADEGYEQVTLNVLYDWAVDIGDEEAYILYAHTKGTGYVYDTQEPWRGAMTWYNVTRAAYALEALHEGADACGIHYMEGVGDQPRYFGGNFWWAKASAIRALGSYPEQTNRYSAEIWLAYLPHRKEGARLVDLSPGISIGTGPPE